MTDDDIRDLARRTAAKYSHRSDPAFIAYTFLPNTLIDFARKLLSADDTSRTAIDHLQSVLNRQRSAQEQWAADTAAREWLRSIGSEP